MTFEKIRVTFRGENFEIKNGQTLGKGEQSSAMKALFSIFDDDKNGKIEGYEFNALKDFSSGIFDINEDATKVTYKEDGYSTEWHFNEAGLLTKRTKDTNGDLKTDFVLINEYKDKDNYTQRKLEDIDCDGKVDITSIEHVEKGETTSANVIFSAGDNTSELKKLDFATGEEVPVTNDADINEFKKAQEILSKENE